MARRKPDTIDCIEIVLSNGLHIRLHPATQTAFSWLEHKGYIGQREQLPLRELIKILNQVKEARRG